MPTLIEAGNWITIKPEYCDGDEHRTPFLVIEGEELNKPRVLIATPIPNFSITPTEVISTYMIKAVNDGVQHNGH